MAERLGTQLQSGGLEQSIHTGLLGSGLVGGASLDLNFAVTKNVGPLVTFTRASSATYIDSAGTLQTAAVDVPRFDHNPTTGESLGLLVEEQRTNSFIYSNTFTDASWGQIFGTTITRTASAAVSPDGTSNATQITATDANFVRQQAVGDTTTIRSLSFFAKAGTASTISVRFFSGTAPNSPTATFNLSTGAATVSDASVMTASIVPFPNGWYRCICCRTDAASKGPPDFNFGVGTTFIYGAQLEAGAFPTSYIPTTTTAATRSADVASITGTNFSSWYNQTEGTLLCNAKDAIVFPSSLRHYADLTPNSLGYSISIVQSNAGYTGVGQNIVAGVYNSSLQAAIDLSAQTAEALRVAIAYKANDVSASRNGVLGTPDTVASLPTPDRLLIGSAATLRHCNSPISRITYWPQRLPNSTLQAITQ